MYLVGSFHSCICTTCFKQTKTLHFAHTIYLYVSYYCQTKTDCFSKQQEVVCCCTQQEVACYCIVWPVCYLCSTSVCILFVRSSYFIQACHSSVNYWSALQSWFNPRLVNVCLWHEKWNWEMFLIQYFSFCLPISFPDVLFHLYITKWANLANVHTKPFFFEILHDHCREKPLRPCFWGFNRLVTMDTVTWMKLTKWIVVRFGDTG